VETPDLSARPDRPPPWRTALTAAVLVGLVLVGGLWLRTLRSGDNPTVLPNNHVALVWEDWVFLAPPAPGTRPGPLAPADPQHLGEVSLSDGDFQLLSALQAMRPDGRGVRTVPNPFATGQPPTVAGFWEPVARRRAAAKVERPLVVFLRAPIYLSPFQTALSWSDPTGRVIVVNLEGLGLTADEMAPRIARLLRHEYGHLAGCTHRDGCVMETVSTVAQLDALPLDYCGLCMDKIGEFPFMAPQYGEVVRKVNPE